jgi:branched-subunit amino acid ABC-type transport system permease component
MIVFTLGLWLVLEFGMAAVWGTDLKRFDTPSQIANDIGPFLLTNNQLIIIGLAVVVLIAVHLLLRLTKIGKAMRAVSDNRDLAAACGIAPDAIAGVTWALSGALLGIAGNVLALNIATFQPFFGDAYLFVVVSAVILGGAGHVFGAMLAALVVGMVSEVSTLYVNSAFKVEMVFLVFLVLVLLRPHGLIRARARVME